MDCGKFFAKFKKSAKNKRHIDEFLKMKEVFMRLTKIGFGLLANLLFASFPYGECCR